MRRFQTFPPSPRDREVRTPKSGLREHSHDLPISLSPLTARWKRGIILRMNDPQLGGSHGKQHRTTKILSRARLRSGRLAARSASAAARAGAALMFVYRRATAAVKNNSLRPKRLHPAAQTRSVM